jgi:predicted nucleic acid-binding protein
MSRKILIDTCAWIDFLRGKEGALGNAVERALSDDAVIAAIAQRCGVPVLTIDAHFQHLPVTVL